MATQHWPRQIEPRQCSANRSKNSPLCAHSADHRFFRPPILYRHPVVSPYAASAIRYSFISLWRCPHARLSTKKRVNNANEVTRQQRLSCICICLYLLQVSGLNDRELGATGSRT